MKSNYTDKVRSEFYEKNKKALANGDYGFTVYPNPLSGTATVKLNLKMPNGNAQLYVYDVTSRRVKTYNLSKNQEAVTLRANEIGAGMFFTQLVSDGNPASAEVAMQALKIASLHTFGVLLAMTL